MKRANVLRLLALLALATLAGLALYLLPIQETLGQLLAWVQEAGPWGPVVLAAAYVPASVLFVPGSLLSLGAGFAFGVVTGSVAVSLGSITGAATAFWAGRTLARGLIEEKVAGSPRFRALDRAVAERGFWIVLLTRLSPVLPFALLNYAFALTRVRFRDYFFASWIGMVPGTLLYVSLGAAAKNLADLAAGRVESDPAQKVLFGFGLAATVFVTLYITRLARRALAQALPAAQGEKSPPDEIPPG
jgi:uncharacterized membrane protein YdjX (TVP38/TMEM64 family)